MKELETIREMANRFFYTLSVNYSMQVYVAQDYLGEDTKSINKHKHKSTLLEDVWINALFHKNDGYMSPLNLSPFRDRGKIDMNKEIAENPYDRRLSVVGCRLCF